MVVSGFEWFFLLRVGLVWFCFVCCGFVFFCLGVFGLLLVGFVFVVVGFFGVVVFGWWVVVFRCVLLVGVVGGTMDMSEWRRLCSRCVNSTSLRLPRMMKNSGLLYF